jgi:hypothetical protein
METGTEVRSAAEVLAAVGKPLPGMKAQDYDPMESIPTLSVGEGNDILPGQLLVGTFVETDRLVSAKFKNSQEKDVETGLPVQYRHVLINGDTKFAIWNCGELKQIFKKIAKGTYVELTYIGKGENFKGQQQHNFKVKVAAPSVN